MRQGGFILAAGRVRSKKKKNKKTREKIRPTQTPHEIHSTPATASNARRHARKHVPHVSPYSPASMDPGFTEIGLVQLSVSKNDECYTHTDRHTDRRTVGQAN